MPAAPAGAQEAVDVGLISGAIQLLTPGAEFSEAEVELISVDGGSVSSVGELTTEDGSFEFEAPAVATVNYFVRVDYDDILYLSNPVLISPELPTATVDFEVYATVDDAPDLSIDLVLVTVLAIDRQRAELTVIREDLVRNDELVIYDGGDSGVTLRIPAPDGTLDAGGVDESAGDYTFEGDTVSATTPLRPGVTSVVTRYTVRYEADEDEYRLRITTPLTAEEMRIRVPERFLREVNPEGDDATLGADEEFEGEPLIVVERTAPATPGQSLIADLQGLSGIEPASHPLTSRTGAAVGAILALVVVAGLAVALQRSGARPE